MFRKLLRDYLSLTRGERRGLQVLGFLIIFLILVRGFMPRLVQMPEQDFTAAFQDFRTFQDSLQKLDALTNPNAFDILEARSDPNVYEITDTRAEMLEVKGEARPGKRKAAPRESIKPFLFDPNTAGFEELINLGLSSRVASTLLNFRDAGGKFFNDSDLLKIYGLEPDLYNILEPFINILPDTIDEKMPFELNRADSMQLISVYGIGPVFAGRILRYRNSLGGFYRTEQLLEIYGITPSQYEELISGTYLDTSLVRKLDLNGLEAAELATHPYINTYQGQAIHSYRIVSGRFEKITEVIENRLLPDTTYKKIQPYLDAGR